MAKNAKPNNDTPATAVALKNEPKVRVRAERRVNIREVGTRNKGDEFDCPESEVEAFGKHLTRIEQPETREDSGIKEA